MEDFRNNRELNPPVRIKFETTNENGETTVIERVFNNDDNELTLPLLIAVFRELLIAARIVNEDEAKQVQYVEDTEVFYGNEDED